jgi:hypothetical protein
MGKRMGVMDTAPARAAGRNEEGPPKAPPKQGFLWSGRQERAHDNIQRTTWSGADDGVRFRRSLLLSAGSSTPCDADDASVVPSTLSVANR